MKQTILTFAVGFAVVTFGATSGFAEGTNCNGCGRDRLSENVSIAGSGAGKANFQDISITKYVTGLGIPEETWALVAAATEIPKETWIVIQSTIEGIPEETWALAKAADGIPEETWAILKNADGIPEEVYALKANLDGIPEETWAMRNAEFAGDVFNNAVSPKLTLQAAGPLAIGLGAIIAIGAIRNGDSAVDTSR